MCKKLGHLEDALDCFIKLHAILRNNAEVIYQIANLYPFLIDPSPIAYYAVKAGMLDIGLQYNNAWLFCPEKCSAPPAGHSWGSLLFI